MCKGQKKRKEVIKAIVFFFKEGNTYRNLNGLEFLISTSGKIMLDSPVIAFKLKSCTLGFKNSTPHPPPPGKEEEKKTGNKKTKKSSNPEKAKEIYSKDILTLLLQITTSSKI